MAISFQESNRSVFIRTLSDGGTRQVGIVGFIMISVKVERPPLRPTHATPIAPTAGKVEDRAGEENSYVDGAPHNSASCLPNVAGRLHRRHNHNQPDFFEEEVHSWNVAKSAGACRMTVLAPVSDPPMGHCRCFALFRLSDLCKKV